MKITNKIVGNPFRLTARLAERRLCEMIERKDLYKHLYKQLKKQKPNNDKNCEIEKSLLIMSTIHKNNHLHDELLNSPMLLT